MIHVSHNFLGLILILLCSSCFAVPVQKWPEKTAVGTTSVTEFQNLENSERLGLSKPDFRSDNNTQSKEYFIKNQTVDGKIQIPAEAAELLSQTVTNMTTFLKESNEKFRQIQIETQKRSVAGNSTNDIDRSDYFNLPAAGSFSPMQFFMDDNPLSLFNKIYGRLLHNFLRFEVNNSEKIRRNVEVLRAIFWPINKLVVIGNRILTYQADQNQIKYRTSNDTYQFDFAQILRLVLEQLTVLLEPDNRFPSLK